MCAHVYSMYIPFIYTYRQDIYMYIQNIYMYIHVHTTHKTCLYTYISCIQMIYH